MKAIKQTDFSFPHQTGMYRGKVRDVYYFDDLMVMVASDRISAFDVILPEAIPDKGRVLNLIAARNLEATKDLVANWVLEVPDPNVTIGRRCTPYPVEMVVRGYVSGHAWREYRDGKRTLCGVPLPDGLRESDPLPSPILTPSTKAHEGHDEDISREEIIKQGLVPAKVYEEMEDCALRLFARGTELARARGLILVDTKYEFGDAQGKVTLIDEVHTPDSSRYFYQSGYDERQSKGLPQKQLSKEFVRQWLIENGFQGLPRQRVPAMTPDVVAGIAARYRELYEQVTGETLDPVDYEAIPQRMEEHIRISLNRLNFRP